MPTLTRRERDILAAVTEPGSSRREAAHRLGISEHTVNHYLRELYRRHEVNSAAQLVAALAGLSMASRPRLA